MKDVLKNFFKNFYHKSFFIHKFLTKRHLLKKKLKFIAFYHFFKKINQKQMKQHKINN